MLGNALHRMPQIGELSPGLWLASGFGGHGLNTTAMAGEIIARAIVDGDDTWRLFSPYELVWAGGRIGRALMQAYTGGSRRASVSRRARPASARRNTAARRAAALRAAEDGDRSRDRGGSAGGSTAGRSPAWSNCRPIRVLSRRAGAGGAADAARCRADPAHEHVAHEDMAYDERPSAAASDVSFADEADDPKPERRPGRTRADRPVRERVSAPRAAP